MRNRVAIGIIVVAVALVVSLNYFGLQRGEHASENEAKEATEQGAKQAKKAPPPVAAPKINKEYGARELAALGAGANPGRYRDMDGSVVTLHTDKGNIVIKLFDRLAPITVDNFLRLAAAGYYKDMTFHRVEPGFVIQTGDPTATGRGGPGWQIPDEIHAKNSFEIGTVGMANSGPNTGGSQFFICMGAAHYLDQKHTAFGQVLEGMDVVNSIAVGDGFDGVTIEKRWTPTTAAQRDKKPGGSA